MVGELEAWLKLAELWDKPVTGRWTFVEFEPWRCMGLCACINSMLDSDTISWNTCVAMKRKVPYPRFGDYVWPRTEEGAKQRAAFCREQAEREAWLKLAETWDKPDPFPAGGVWIKEYGSLGLCGSISALFDGVNQDMHARMISKIPKRTTLFVWPRTEEGAKQRAAFCREQADAIRTRSVVEAR
jgi:hypothetical protein